MSSNAILRSFYLNQQPVTIFVPENLSPSQNFHSPYWAKVWPAAIGLCNFLQNNLDYIRQKKLLEIAAGLGLPSIFAAQYAAQVYCTDIEPAAVELAQQSVLHNQIRNVQCAVANWNNYAELPLPDTVLLSDVNYEPVQFDQLLKAIHFYLQNHCTVILGTPQRLMAKPFIEQLLPFCKQQEEIMVTEKGIDTAVSIFVLQHV